MPLKIKVSDLLGKHKMTQKQLSDKTGIRPATVHTLYHETAKRLEVEHIEKLCEVFQCDVGDIFEYTPRKNISEANVKEPQE